MSDTPNAEPDWIDNANLPHGGEYVVKQGSEVVARCGPLKRDWDRAVRIAEALNRGVNEPPNALQVADARRVAVSGIKLAVERMDDNAVTLSTRVRRWIDLLDRAGSPEIAAFLLSDFPFAEFGVEVPDG